MQADPIKYVATRPSFNPTDLVGLETEFRKALYIRNFSNVLLAEKGALNAINVARYRIDLDISQLQFNNHHLFSIEHMLAFNLKSMFQHYIMTQEQNLIEILTAKVLFNSISI
jgi:hypothetical protein